MCQTPHTKEMPQVDWAAPCVPVVKCPECGTEFVIDDGDLVPVSATVLVAEAVANEDRLGWDGARARALSDEPHWGRLLDGPC